MPEAVQMRARHVFLSKFGKCYEPQKEVLCPQDSEFWMDAGRTLREVGCRHSTRR